MARKQEAPAVIRIPAMIVAVLAGIGVGLAVTGEPGARHLFVAALVAFVVEVLVVLPLAIVVRGVRAERAQERRGKARRGER